MKIILRRLVPVAALLATAAPLLAQPSNDTIPPGMPPLVRTLFQEFAATLDEYWTPRFNAYKRSIDTMLSVHDLCSLDSLRARYAILKELNRREMARAAEELYTMSGSPAGTTTTPDSTEEEVRGLGAISAEEEREIEEYVAREGELEEVDRATRAMADRYRPRLAELTETFRGDLSVFFDTLSVRLTRLRRRHTVEMASDARLREFFNQLADGLKGFSREIGNKESFARTHRRSTLEPEIFLYHGQGIDRLLGGLLGGSGIPSPLMERSEALSITLPSPTSNQRTIGFALEESSTNVTLDIIDISGAIVKTVDLGEQSAGAHTITVDVSDLAKGAYLYRLEFEAPSGRRVVSAVM